MNVKPNKTLALLAAGMKHYSSASGDVVSFMGDGSPLKSLAVDIRPVQEGSGDPSPENVRPISGWTGAQVTRAGKNLLHNYPMRTVYGITFEYDPTQNCFHIYGTSTLKFTSTYCVGGGDIFIETNLLPGVECVFSMGGNIPNEIKKIQLEVVYSDNTSDLFLAGVPFTLSKPSTRQRVRWYNQYDIGYEYNIANTYDIKLYPQLELGYAPTAYEAYAGDVIPISWESEAGTVYGGTLDVLSGVLTATHMVVGRPQSISSITSVQTRASDNSTSFWMYNSTGSPFATGAEALCNMAKYNPQRDTEALQINEFRVSDQYRTSWNMRFSSSVVGTTRESIYEYFSEHPLQMYFALINPITYQLTPRQVSALLGRNNIWADGGPVSVEYSDPQPGKLALLLRNRREAEVLSMRRKEAGE